MEHKPVEVGAKEFVYSRTAAVADAWGKVQRRGGGSGNQKRAEHARRRLAQLRQDTQIRIVD
jgi:hypothetical protein